MATGSGRRPRTDSAAAAVRAFATAKERLEWPELEVTRMTNPEDDQRAQAIFSKISTSRAPEDWRQHDAVLIAQLAVVQVSLDQAMVELTTNGWTALGGKTGLTPVRSPMLDVAQHLSSRALALSRALGITGDPIDGRTVAKNAKTLNAARAIAEDNDPNGLLA